MFQLMNRMRWFAFRNGEVGDIAETSAQPEFSVKWELNGPIISVENTEQQQYYLEHSFSKIIPPKFLTDIRTTSTVPDEKGCRREVVDVIYVICSDTFIKEDFIVCIKDCEGFQCLESDKYDPLLHDEKFKRIIFGGSSEGIETTCFRYTENNVEVFRKQRMLSRTDKFILQGNLRAEDHQIPPISTSYFRMIMNYINTEVMEDGSKPV